MTGENYVYGKKYIFRVPQHKFIGRSFLPRFFISLLIRKFLYYMCESFRGRRRNRNVRAFYVRRRDGFAESGIARTIASTDVQCDGI